MRAVGKARAKTLIEAAEHSVEAKKEQYLQEWRSECFWKIMNPEIYVFRKL